MNLIPPDEHISGKDFSDHFRYKTTIFSFHEIQWNLKDDDGGIANFVLKNFEYLSVSSGKYKMTLAFCTIFLSKMGCFKLKKSIPYFMSSQTSSISFTNLKFEILNYKIFYRTRFIQGFWDHQKSSDRFRPDWL